jgi:putative ABC transport system substrate-binding protein
LKPEGVAVDRRTFLGSVSFVLLLSAHAIHAQQTTGKIPVVGVLNSGPLNPRSLEGARQGLRELGYVEGQTIVLEVRYASGRPEELPGATRDLISRKVDMLMAIGPAALKAAHDATRTVPIVAYDLESDPVHSGFARTLAQPAGNVTGLFLDLPGLTGKWLELLKEAAPRIRPVTLLWDSTTGDRQLSAARDSAQRLGLEVRVVEVRNADDLDRLLAAPVKAGTWGGVVQMSSPLFELRTKSIVDFTLRQKLPAISISTRFTEAGGLLSYGPTRPEFGRRLAVYIDKILKGANPGELPIEQPTKFELVANLKAAKALGLALPPSLLARADKVIQ